MLINELRAMDEYTFEHFIADLWEAQGWDATVTSESQDAGVDIIAERENPVPQKMVIQAKRYGKESAVTGPDIQQYHSLQKQENADTVVVVTTGRFTGNALDRAEDLDVKLIDGDELVGLVQEAGGKEVINDYQRSESGPREVAMSVSDSLYSLPHLIFGISGEEEDRFFGITSFGYLSLISLFELVILFDLVSPSILPFGGNFYAWLGFIGGPIGAYLIYSDDRTVALPFSETEPSNSIWAFATLITVGFMILPYVILIVEDTYSST